MSDESILTQVRRGLDYIESQGKASWTKLSDGLVDATEAVVSQTKRTLADTGAAAWNYTSRVGASPFDPRSPNQAPAAQPPTLRGEDVMPGETAPGGAFSPEARAHEESRPAVEQFVTGALAGAPTAALGPGAVIGDVESALAEVERTGGDTTDKWLAGSISALPVVGAPAAVKAASKLKGSVKALFGGTAKSVEAGWSRLLDDLNLGDDAVDAELDAAMREAPPTSGDVLDIDPADLDAHMPEWQNKPEPGVTQPQPGVPEAPGAAAVGVSNEALDRLADEDLGSLVNPVHSLQRLAQSRGIDPEPAIQRLGQRLGAKPAASALTRKLGGAGGISPGGMFEGADGQRRYVKTSMHGGLTGLLEERGAASAYNAVGRKAPTYELLALTPEDSKQLASGYGMGKSLAGQRFALASPDISDEWVDMKHALEAPGGERLFTPEVAREAVKARVADIFFGNYDVASNAGNIMVRKDGSGGVLSIDVGAGGAATQTRRTAENMWGELMGTVRATGFGTVLDEDSTPDDLIALAVEKAPEQLKGVKADLQAALDALEAGAGSAGKDGEELYQAMKAFAKQHWPHYSDGKAAAAGEQFAANAKLLRERVSAIAAALVLIGFPGLELYGNDSTSN